MHFRDDIELAGRAARGDRAARRELVTFLLPQVRRTMSYFTRSSALADDMTQLALVRLLQQIGTYRGESTIEYWANKLAFRVALDDLKKTKRRKRLSEKIPEPDSPYAGTEDGAMTLQAKALLGDAMNKLHDDQKTVIVLKYVEGYSVSEIAEFAEIPPNTVRIRLMRGKAKLRKLLSRHKGLEEWVLEKAQ